VRPALVIVTTHFGTNFSGGSTATCEILSRLEHEFSAIHVIANEIGEHPFRTITWHRYRSAIDALLQIHRLSHSKPIFYADFYNAYWLSLLRLPYCFTYHDNWPELGAIGPQFRLQQLYYWPIYRFIFRTAKHVITVSERKRQLLKDKCRQITLVRNGCQRNPAPASQHPREHVLMVGNIDARKYAKAVELFKTLPYDTDINIDIYGHPTDVGLTNRLAEFPFVTLKGFQTPIPYARYQLLLHTSMMENLSIVWCEALLHKTPVLTFNVGAADEVVTKNTGALIAAYDLKAMQYKLNALAHSPITIDSTPDHLTKFNWDTAARQYQHILFDSIETPVNQQRIHEPQALDK